VQAFDALRIGQIRLHGLHFGGVLPQYRGGLLDLGFVGGDQQVEAVVPAELRQFESDAGKKRLSRSQTVGRVMP
jgi:hypothetical protein